MPAEPPICPYCGRDSTLCDGRTIYRGRDDLWDKAFWRCAPCDAYVGCHKGSRRPLGTLANKELRAARRRAHAAFDPLWREQPALFASRKDAYKWLAAFLACDQDLAHISNLNVLWCLSVEAACLAMDRGRIVVAP